MQCMMGTKLSKELGSICVVTAHILLESLLGPVQVGDALADSELLLPLQ